MLKLMGVLVVSAAAVLGASALAGAAGTGTTHQSKPAAVVPVLGSPVSVPKEQFVKAYAYCPKGYVVTGGGSYNGAITEIASSPTKDLRGWFVDGTNNDPLNRTFQHRADAVCVKGSATSSGLAAAATDVRLANQAEREYRASHSQ